MRRDCLGDEIDSLRCAISKESTGAIQMPHTMRIQTHQPRTREVGGNGIVSENDLTQMSVLGPVGGPLPSMATIASAMTK